MKFVTQTAGKAKITWQQTSSDTKASLTAANIVNAAGEKAIGVLITLETYDVRYTLDGDTSPTITGVGHKMIANSGLILDNPGEVRDFQFISKTTGEHGVLTITSLFLRL